MLMWVDEIAWMAVSEDYPGCHFVTVGMSEVTFHKGVHPQSVLRFETTKARVGRTSVTYHVEVFRRHIESSEETGVFTTDITFVRIGSDGAKMPIGEEHSFLFLPLPLSFYRYRSSLPLAANCTKSF